MAPVQLKITEPAHGAFVAAGATALKGELLSTAPAPLYYRWYSSLFPATKARMSINRDAVTDVAAPYTATLALGHHVLTLGASDKPAEADIANSVHGGVAGGEGACEITALSAEIVAPAANAALSRANATMIARAPLRAAENASFELDRLRYRWRFAGPATAEIAGPPLAGDPAGAFTALDFEEQSSPPPPPPQDPGAPTPRGARYTGPLPDALTPGTYQLTLRVEAAFAPTHGAETSIQVAITA